MTDRLPRDREKALEAIATGRYTGRVATSAHPLCRCQDLVTYPPRPEFDSGRLCGGQEQIDYIRKEWPVLMREWRDACEAARLAGRCVVHDRTPSVWSMP